jgi:hypothetical protein
MRWCQGPNPPPSGVATIGAHLDAFPFRGPRYSSLCPGNFLEWLARSNDPTPILRHISLCVMAQNVKLALGISCEHWPGMKLFHPFFPGEPAGYSV